MSEKLVRIMDGEPAYDKRDPDPKKNYGIHGLTLRFVVKGKKGAVQFVLYTGWQLPHVTKEFRIKMTPDNYCLYEPMPADLGYHSPKPMWEGQDTIQEKCEYLDDKPCYYDGSSLNADNVFKVLVAEGMEAMWKYLESYYQETFEETYMKPRKRCPIEECHHKMRFSKLYKEFRCSHCGYPNFVDVQRWKEYRASLPPLPIKRLIRNVITKVVGGRKIDDTKSV